MRGLIAAVQRAGLIALAAALLIWPALLDGRPALFPDTALYYAEADYLMQALGVVAPGRSALPAGDPTRLPDRPREPNMSADVDGGRSPVWAGVFYLLQRMGTVWLVAYAQACAAALAVYLLYRAVLPEAPLRRYLVLMAVLAGASSLPVFATLMMPDVFGGVAAVAILLVLLYWDRSTPLRRAGGLGLLAFSLASHGSNPIVAVLAAGAGAGALALGGMRAGEAAKRAAAILLVAAVAVAGVRLSYLPIQARAGEAIGSPPFLSARVLADGPGRAYLRRACDAGAGFALCPYDHKPLDNSDDILWSAKPSLGAFKLADDAARRRMEREDLRFAFAVFAAHPWAQAAAALANAGRQFVSVDLFDSFADQDRFTLDGYWRRTSLPRIMPDAAACSVPRRCAPRLSVLVDLLAIVGVVASALFAAWRLAQPDMRAAWGRAEADGDRGRLLRLVLLATLVLTVNAVVCGVLSGPFARYQARMTWIAPLVVALLVARVGARRSMSKQI